MTTNKDLEKLILDYLRVMHLNTVNKDYTELVERLKNS